MRAASLYLSVLALSLPIATAHAAAPAKAATVIPTVNKILNWNSGSSAHPDGGLVYSVNMNSQSLPTQNLASIRAFAHFPLANGKVKTVKLNVSQAGYTQANVSGFLSFGTDYTLADLPSLEQTGAWFNLKSAGKTYWLQGYGDNAKLKP